MLQDFKYALRSLSRNPLFTLGAVATLALGIGVNSTIFTLANAALFQPAAGVAEPDRLAWVATVFRDRGRETGMSYPDYVVYRESSHEIFVDMLAFHPTPLSLGSGGEPERIRGHIVSGSYFAALGVTAAAGRLLDASDDRRGSAAPVVVLSHRLWQRRFGGAEDIVQKSITINGRAFAVIGVAAPSFSGVLMGEAADVWMPIAVWPQLMTSQASLLDERGATWLHVMGRLHPGVSIGRAQSAMAAIAAGLETAHPEAEANKSVAVSAAGPIAPDGRGEAIPLAALLMTVSALVLIIACANVANLLLARGAGRSTELGIRAAIGATRGRLVRQLLTESAVLAGAGALSGLLLSFWAADLLVSLLPSADFQGLRAGADGRVLIFTALLAALSVCVFGLLPALTSTRRALLPRLRETASAGGGRSRLQGIFVVAQLSLSLVLLLAAGLSLRALQKAGTIDLGFNANQLLSASYDLVLQNYTPAGRDVFRAELLRRMRALPGVTSATVANVPPLSGTMVRSPASSTDDQGRPLEAGGAFMNAVGPQYFTTLQIPLVRGRAIGEEDTRGSTPAAVINEALARRISDAGEVLGRRLTINGLTYDIVGVARMSKYDEATEDPQPFVYVPLTQDSPLDRETLIVRTAGAPAAMSAIVQSEIRRLDPVLPVFDVRSFDTILKDRADKQRGVSTLFAAFGVLALGLAALGLYGVMAYAVTRRTREMGVRLALGATPAQLTRLIAGDGLRLALTGVAIGGALALPLARVLGALIFGVQIGDLAAFVATCALLVLVAMAAAVLPARRAARLDPMFALRSE